MSTEVQAVAAAVAVPSGNDSHRFAVSRAPVEFRAEVAPAAAQPQEQELQEAVDQIRQHIEESRTGLEFRVDKDLGRVIVSIVDRKDGKVLRQIPGEDVLRIARMLAKGNGQGLVDAFA